MLPNDLSSMDPFNLERLESILLDAIAQDRLDGVTETFSKLESAATHGQEYKMRVNIIAHNVATVAQAFIEVEEAKKLCTSSLQAEWEAILTRGNSPPKQGAPSRARKPFLQSPRHPTSKRNASNLTSITQSTSIPDSDPNPLPEFVEHAYKFFVANIFNPYPTREEKQTIVEKSNHSDITFNSISNWFINVRRRCGWTEILRQRFDGNKELMVDVAKQVFLHPNPSRPVDPEVVAEFMEFKENVESMYENLRVSPWIEDLEGLDELVNPLSEEERIANKRREAEEGREARRLAKGILKEQRGYEKEKQKMQSEALRKTAKIARVVHGEQGNGTKGQRLVSRSASSSLNDEEESLELVSTAGSKRKAHHEDYSTCGSRNSSGSSLSPSSSFSEFSSDDRVPSLTWSDSGDEERPYKRFKYVVIISLRIRYLFSHSRSIPPTPQPSSIFDPNAVYSLTLNPLDTVLQTPPRGQKRSSSIIDNDITPRSKRIKSNTATFASWGEPQQSFDLTQPLLFSHPSSSSSATSMQVTQSKSSVIAADFEAILDESFLSLNSFDPPSVEMRFPEADLPIEVFNWSNLGAEGLDMGNLDSQWLQFLQQPQDALEGVEQAGQSNLSSTFSSVFPDEGLVSRETNESQPFENPSDPQNQEFMDSLFATFKNPFSLALPKGVPNLPSSPLPAPVLSEYDLSPLEPIPNVANLAKALLKEEKRRELQEKKAALEREQARLIEMERALEED